MRASARTLYFINSTFVIAKAHQRLRQSNHISGLLCHFIPRNDVSYDKLIK